MMDAIETRFTALEVRLRPLESRAKASSNSPARKMTPTTCCRTRCRRVGIDWRRGGIDRMAKEVGSRPQGVQAIDVAAAADQLNQLWAQVPASGFPKADLGRTWWKVRILQQLKTFMCGQLHFDPRGRAAI
jgi:hypothetical protein